MSSKSIAALTLLLLGLTQATCGLAAGEATPRPGKRSMLPATNAEDQFGRGVFQALVGEFALQRGEGRLASDALTELAVRTRDPKVLARATEVSTQLRQFDRALELSRLWLDTEPESGKARQMRSSLLALTNRVDELAPQLATLLAEEPANLGGNLLHLNRLLARIEDKKALQQLVDRLASPYKGLPEAHFAMAQAAANAGDNGRALDETEQALRLKPDWEMAALARTQLQVRQSEKLATESLDDFVKRNPEAREARLALARLLIAGGRYAESRTHFDRLYKENPDNPEVLYPLAMLALQNGDANTGRTLLERLLQSDLNDKSAVHYFLGQLEQEQKQADAALAHYQQVTGGEQYLNARTRAAQLLMQQGKTEAARMLLRETKSSTPAERTHLLLTEAQLLRESGRMNDAYIALESALNAQPDNPELLYEAALTGERIGKPEILESRLKRLLELKPDHAHALNALGYSLAERNIRLSEAFQLVSKALQLAPEDPFIMDSMGWVLFRQGKLPEALKTLESAYAIKADPEIAAHIGEVLWQLGRKDEARRLLADAARQHPDNDVLSAAIKKLQP